MVLVTRPAPDFTAAAVLGNGEIVENFNFKQHTNGKATVLFFWPMDFTFVCPSELIAFDKRYEEFQKRGVEVVGVSFDSEFVHNAWRNTPVDKRRHRCGEIRDGCGHQTRNPEGLRY
ncbi:alkyl hydroperoxide reductase [Enterobacter cancerogenus]|uniref:Thioredoxin peroxidase n=1 Tax=Enterobacter cancerogenus TaxID=69218 RepID=A0A484XMF5_9ENTR|nr:alkyl hydroperoxide reductase [Enterobacter cancerogenus]